MQRKSLLTLMATLAILILLLSAALTASAQKGDPPGVLPNSLSITGAAPPPAGPIVFRPSQNPDALVNDGSFENGPPPASAWTEVTNVGCEWIGDWSAVWGVAAYDGIYDFWAGGYCGGVPATSSVSQAGIPVPATDNDLHFWYLAYRPDADDGDNDRAYVNVNGTPVWTLPLLQANNTFPNWVEVVVPMAAYAGTNVTLEFGGISEGASTGNIRFDAISFGAPPPPPERCPAGSAEVTVLTQDFEGSFPPAGWVVANSTTGCVAPGVPDWTNTDPGARTNLTGGSGLFAIADSDACGSSSVMNAQMWTPAIDLTGLTDPQITYYTDYYDISSTSDVADLDFSVDGGATWTNLISWNSSHRGPLMVEQAFTAGNQPNTRLRWNYTNATWDWWWEVDSVEVTACEPQTNAAIELNKTVGTTPGVCAVGDTVTVTAGTEVYYCYQVENTGNVALNFHDLEDSELGVLADNLPYALLPGAFSPQVIVPATPMASVTNTGTWTAVSALAGYTADDTIPYNFQDISGTGTAFALSDDEVSAALPMGFSFDFFGTGYSNAYASSNGFLTFTSTTNSGCCSGQALPNPAEPNNLVAGWWEDLDPGEAGAGLYYQTLGTAPNRVFIVQFSNVQHFPSGNPATFQYKLFETTNVVEVHYQAAPSDGGTHSAGIENADGSVGVQWVYGTAGLATPDAVQYAPAAVYSASDTDTATVTVLTPNIDVDPLGLSSSQSMNIVTTVPMTVTNTGDGDLTWEIAEEPVARPPEQLRGGDAVSAADVFDGKAPQSGDSAAPELSSWRAPEAVLYDNGPLVTHPAGGAGGADASALQTALGLDTYGFGNQFAAGNRIADDFTVGGSGWLINTITFFGYQTGSGGTSTFTAVNLQIWDGPPDDPTSMVVFGDTTTNRLVSSTWSNIYRVLDTALTNTDRPVMANVATVNTFLPAGTYWLDWQADGTLGSGPWAPPVTFLGQTGKPGANALQWTGAWAPALDGGIGTPQDFPFIIEGLSDCSNLSDVPWLSASPTNGTNTGGTSTPIDVTLDSTGLAMGTYSARLCVTSNDPDVGPGNGTGLVILPVTLEVENQCPSGSVSGELTTTDPTFNRPVSGNPGCFPDPYVGTHVRYDVYSYNLTGPEPGDVWASLCGSTAFDQVLIVYQAPDGSMAPFNPAQPCTNAVAYDDDWCQSQPLIDEAIFGNGWIDIVVAGYANSEMGPYTLNLDSNSCNGGAAQIDVSPLAVNNGAACMNQNTQVTQPMTVQNVGDRSLYTWAAGSSRASCIPVSEVPWLRLPEASFATAAGAASSVGVTFDSTGYAPGVYTANVCFASNDPDAGDGVVIVPATMTVCSVPTAVGLSGLAATPAPLPLGIPLAALPAAAGLALAAAYAARRRK